MLGQRRRPLLVQCWSIFYDAGPTLVQHWVCCILGPAPQQKVSGSLGMSGGTSPRHTQNSLLGERRKTLSITHHALSPHRNIIICTSFISPIDYNVFIVLQCHLRSFVPKSDVKDYFFSTLFKNAIV